MKPFDLEKALAGEPVCTRDGKPVTQLVRFAGVGELCLYGVIDGVVEDWNVDGVWDPGRCGTQRSDIFMAPRKRTVWVNLYAQNYANGKCTFGGAHPSQEEADSWASKQPRVGGKAWPLEIED